MQGKSKSILILGFILSLLLLAAVGGVSAEEDTPVVPSINDGRVNATDISAPVAVFCQVTYPFADDVNMGVVSAIELWGLTNSEDGIFHEIAVVSSDEIAAVRALEGAGLVTQNYGYSLYAHADGSLTIVAAPDTEGKVYQFSWTPGAAINC
jgi:hypothetical protein